MTPPEMKGNMNLPGGDERRILQQRQTVKVQPRAGVGLNARQGDVPRKASIWRAVTAEPLQYRSLQCVLHEQMSG